MNPEVVSSKPCVAGRTVDVMVHGGGIKNVHFEGFVEVECFTGLSRTVKLVNIAAYSTDSDPHFSKWTHYCRHTILLGQLAQNGVYLCLSSNTKFPMAWCELGANRDGRAL